MTAFMRPSPPPACPRCGVRPMVAEVVDGDHDAPIGTSARAAARSSRANTTRRRASASARRGGPRPTAAGAAGNGVPDRHRNAPAASATVPAV